MRTLDEIATDYERSEVTALWVHDSGTNRHVLLYGVAELCPREQPPSDEIRSTKGAESHPMDRAELAPNGMSLYAARVLFDDPRGALAFYRGTAGRRHVTVAGTPITLESLIPQLHEEPPGEQPVLLEGSGLESYAHVLPRRTTSVRVCSRLAHGDAYLSTLSERQQSALRAFTERSLGIDLVKYCEHLGAVHLVLPNPLIRGWSERLAEDASSVLFEFYEREGQSIRGATLQLTDHRPAGIGFDHVTEVTGSRQVVPIPADPQSLETRLRNQHGELVERLKASFLREIRLDMRVAGAQRRVHTLNARGEQEVHVVQTFSEEVGRAAEEETPTPYSLLDTARRRRTRQQLPERKDFFFFPGGNDSRDHARRVVRDLIGGARDRCLLCDPYLSAADVADYATFVRAFGVTVRLIGSAAFLRTAPRGSTVSYGSELRSRIDAIRAADSRLTFDCRVLRGRDVSPVHDRFLMLDSDVFVLGSSLNELGRRATTICRVPDAQTLIAALERWWNDSALCVALDDWLKEREPDNSEDLSGG